MAREETKLGRGSVPLSSSLTCIFGGLFMRVRRFLSAKIIFGLMAVACTLPIAFHFFLAPDSSDVYLAFTRPDEFFERRDGAAGRIEDRKAEILDSINEELRDRNVDASQEETRLLGRLDRLWRSVQDFVFPFARKEASPPPPHPSEETLQRAEQRLPDPEPLSPPPDEPEPDLDTTQVLQNVLALAQDPEVIERASSSEEEPESSGTPAYRRFPRSGYHALEGDIARRRATEKWLYRFQPIEGYRTRSMVYQFSDKLSLEGTLDTPQAGETDSDLKDFGFRAVHAQAVMRDNPGSIDPAAVQRLDSGYPLSYGIGLNLSLSRELDIQFDYSHEFPSSHFIEYNGSWESSLVTDYAQYRPEDKLDIHNFFLGLRYLLRERRTLIPLHTGFFYATNMANEPLSSDVSLGFSIGGGIQRQGIRLGFAYRLRIWEQPTEQLLAVENEENLNNRISNQFLFSVAF